MNTLSGSWRLRHWYPSPDDDYEASTEYIMDAQQHGDTVVFTSRPYDRRTVYLIARLKIVGTLAVCSWYEISRPDGPYGGRAYEGSGLVVITPNGQLEGMWAGAGVDHQAGKPRIYTGRWEFEKI
ncbi:MAG: hypothetical protein ACREGD_03835 [Candidatus Saccharimonadales bacterium]